MQTLPLSRFWAGQISVSARGNAMFIREIVVEARNPEEALAAAKRRGVWAPVIDNVSLPSTHKDKS